MSEPGAVGSGRRLRVLFALAGAHRVSRGAEVAFESVADGLARRPDFEVTMIGSGPHRTDRRYNYWRAGCAPRERFVSWPRVPVFRDHYVYEELTFVPRLWRLYDPGMFDLTVACSYPFCNWVLRTKRSLPGRRGRAGRRPAHVYVTQNGDWPCQARNREFRYFACDGLVCTNPEYHEANRDRWPSALIPNGVDPRRFRPGAGDRSALGLPEGVPLALMVSALIPSKRVLEGIEAVARTDGLHLVVLGDGELAEKARALGRERLGGRFHLRTMPYEQMPEAYRCADVFLHMSQVEPSANAYMEALATGLPIVTHDRVVTRWTLEDQALLVDTDDMGAVAEALTAAMALRTPELVRSRRALVERRYAWSAIADSYATFLHQIHRKHALRPAWDAAEAAPLPVPQHTSP